MNTYKPTEADLEKWPCRRSGDCANHPEFKYAGTVSHGTLRHEDLIPKFESVLKDLNCCKQAILRYRFDQQPGDGEDYAEYVNELIDALDEEAPEGYYFGAIEGDGSDFGFWKIESEEA